MASGIFISIRELSPYFKGETTKIDYAQGIDLDSSSKWSEVDQASVQVSKFVPIPVGAGEESGADAPRFQPFYIGKKPDLTTGLLLESIISQAIPSFTVDIILTRQEAGQSGLNIMAQYTLTGAKICSWDETLGEMERFWLSYRKILRVDYLFKRNPATGELADREPCVCFEFDLDEPLVTMQTIE